jgi:hypothetical protein
MRLPSGRDGAGTPPDVDQLVGVPG